ncbi:hypothetical protein [Mucilaginibacter paludis]|uniref:Uncharacterized protein n=1 Tax=Mucilaginibacter paludis DSM 18603 TaxID=714943 RepID=H1Y5Q9_9SPHI|nr:hypothetical protein [Mucilaginibacter paludis]EHQ29835.1 hypothetical protein Mucpa_5767 [Mucilaginibacter paludis DSM 18603]
MKLVIDIADNKADSFMEVLKSFSYVKAKPLSAPDAAVLEELTHIKKAFKLADKVKAGKIKSRPASELLNEL